MRKAVLLSLLLATRALACTGTPDPALVSLAGYDADGFGQDGRLVQAVVMAESGFCKAAVSPEGAVGLGRLMPGTAVLGVNPWDPAKNLWATARYLREPYDTLGSWPLALAAYYAGPGNVVAYGGVPPFDETHDYVGSVLGDYRNR